MWFVVYFYKYDFVLRWWVEVEVLKWWFGQRLGMEVHSVPYYQTNRTNRLGPWHVVQAECRVSNVATRALSHIGTSPLSHHSPRCRPCLLLSTQLSRWVQIPYLTLAPQTSLLYALSTPSCHRPQLLILIQLSKWVK